MNRRTIFKAAAGALVLATGGAGTFLVTRDPAHARAPWLAAQTEPDPILYALRHGVLAPNPHNRQPWIIALDAKGSADIFCDLDRRLPETDPFDRQILIGFGCFLELTRIAAAEKGLHLDIAPFPEGLPGERLDNRPIARIRFVADSAVVQDPLFPAISVRRSIKEPFDTSRALTAVEIEPLTAEGMKGSIDGVLLGELRKITWDAWLAEARQENTWRESVDLMRIGKSEILANPDGIDLGGPLFDSLHLAGLLSREQIADHTSQAYKAGEDTYREITATSMGFLWLVTEGNSRIEQLDAGRRYVRTHLRAAAAGIAFHPLSQALQEFRAMKPHYDAIHERLGVDRPATVQMLVRIGHFTGTVAPSPRWPLEAKLKPA